MTLGHAPADKPLRVALVEIPAAQAASHAARVFCTVHAACSPRGRLTLIIINISDRDGGPIPQVPHEWRGVLRAARRASIHIYTSSGGDRQVRFGPGPLPIPHCSNSRIDITADV